MDFGGFWQILVDFQCCPDPRGHFAALKMLKVFILGFFEAVLSLSPAFPSVIPLI